MLVCCLRICRILVSKRVTLRKINTAATTNPRACVKIKSLPYYILTEINGYFRKDIWEKSASFVNKTSHGKGRAQKTDAVHVLDVSD